MAGPGIAVGAVAAFAITRVMKELLFGVSAAVPLTFGAVALVLTALTLLASYIPALRATKVDPIVALRYEQARILSSCDRPRLLDFSYALGRNRAPHPT